MQEGLREREEGQAEVAEGIGISCLCRFAVETDKISATAFNCSNAMQEVEINEKKMQRKANQAWRNNEKYDGIKICNMQSNKKFNLN